MANKKAISFSLSALAFVLGCAIYLFLRRPPFIFTALYSSEFVNFFRDFSVQNFSSFIVPDWLKYNLPDLLWMFSMILFIFTLWDYKFNRNSLFWLALCFASGLVLEFMQLFHYLPGHFDIYDLIYMSIGAVMPLLLPIKSFFHQRFQMAEKTNKKLSYEIGMKNIQAIFTPTRHECFSSKIPYGQRRTNKKLTYEKNV